MTKYLPVEPLVRRVEAAGGAAALGVDRSTKRGDALYTVYERARNRGKLQHNTADRLAIELLGQHPTELWDTWVDDGLALTCDDESCDEVATRRGLCKRHYDGFRKQQQRSGQ